MLMILILLISIIIFIYMLFKTYHLFQFLYDTGSISLYTPNDVFPIDDEYTYNYNYITSVGNRYSEDVRVVICTMLRDVEKNIGSIIFRMEKIGEMFNDYVILVVENDSTDSTRKKLLDWAYNNSRVQILGCGINVDTCNLNLSKTQKNDLSKHSARIKKMVTLRNIYLDQVKKHYSNYDYMIVCDLDIIGGIYLDGIANTMGYFYEDKELSAMCANGMYHWGLLRYYYDTYAHIDVDGGASLKGLHVLSRGSPPVKVTSCFSGFTIYRLSHIGDNSMYTYEENSGAVECEHTTFNRHLNKIMMNPSMIYLVVYNY